MYSTKEMFDLRIRRQSARQGDALLQPKTRAPTALAGELIGHAEELRDEALADMRDQGALL